MAISSYAIRYFMLIALFIIAFASFFCFDVPSALQDVFEQLLRINYMEFGLFYSLYAFPNVILCLVGGYLMDRVLGESVSILLFACLSTGGQSLMAVGSYLGIFWLMLVGRVIYSVGNEPLGVTITTFIMKHFRGKQANLIFGLQTAIEFASDCLSLNAANPLFKLVSSWRTQQETSGRVETLGLLQFGVAAFCGISVIMAPCVVWLDRMTIRAERREKEARLAAEIHSATSTTSEATATENTPLCGQPRSSPAKLFHKVNSYSLLRAPRLPRDRYRRIDSGTSRSCSHTNRGGTPRVVSCAAFPESQRPLESSVESAISDRVLVAQRRPNQPRMPRTQSCSALQSTPSHSVNYEDEEYDQLSEIESSTPSLNAAEQECTRQGCVEEAIVVKPRLSFVIQFPAGYWIVMGILMAQAGSLFSLIDVALVFYETKYGLRPGDANLANSLVYMVTVVLCPLAGYAVDRFGRNTLFVLVSICVGLLGHALLAFTFVSPFICSALFGVSYSLFASALWNMVVYLVPQDLLGTAYGLLQAGENLSLGLLILAVGYLLDNAGYFLNELFLFALAALALFLCLLLILWSNCQEDNHYKMLNWSARRREEFLARSAPHESHGAVA